MRSNNSERVLALVFVLCAAATAQWLTFREPAHRERLMAKAIS